MHLKKKTSLRSIKDEWSLPPQNDGPSEREQYSGLTNSWRTTEKLLGLLHIQAAFLVADNVVQRLPEQWWDCPQNGREEAPDNQQRNKNHPNSLSFRKGENINICSRKRKFLLESNFPTQILSQSTRPHPTPLRKKKKKKAPSPSLTWRNTLPRKRLCK